jgi:phosphoribosylanthranilate isomerase
MSRLKIKVCGMRDALNIRQIADLKPDLMGFVFYPASPRSAGEFPAEGMFEAFPPGILKTGVFVDADLYEIKAKILRFGLQTVQLHGQESPEVCRQLMETGIKVIKAFNIAEDTDFSKMMPYLTSTTWFLFDTVSKVHGGSGERFNWKLLDKYQLGQPFFLSGGLDLSDAESILSLKHPALIGIDINSKFEFEPGVKDVSKVKKFCLKIKGEFEK